MRTWICILLVAISVPALAQKLEFARARVPDYTLSVDVNLVVFNVSVLDRNGIPVAGLTQDDFKVLEDGREQTIKAFLAEENPATVGLVIDNSGSMMNKRFDIMTAATEFVRSSTRQDEVFIVNFNDRVRMGLPPAMPFSSDPRQLQGSLLTIAASGRTALYDGLAVSLTHLEKGSHAKKALVVLSDGGDNASTHTLDEVVELARNSSATIYTIAIYDQMNEDRDIKALRELSRMTGGQFHAPRRMRDVYDVWRRIAGGIRTQYTIAYSSDNPARDGTFRRVKVTATDPKGTALDVRARGGYTAAKSLTGSQ